MWPKDQSIRFYWESNDPFPYFALIFTPLPPYCIFSEIAVVYSYSPGSSTIVCVLQLVLLKKLMTCIVFGFSTVAVLPRLPTTLITGQQCVVVIRCYLTTIGGLLLKRSAQLQYNYNNITQKICCIAAVRTSAIQLQYTFFLQLLQVACKFSASCRKLVLQHCIAGVCTSAIQLQYKKKQLQY